MARRAFVRGPFLALASYLTAFGARDAVYVHAAWPHPSFYDALWACIGLGAFPAWFWLKRNGVIEEGTWTAHPAPGRAAQWAVPSLKPFRALSRSAFRCPAFLFDLLQVPPVFLAFVVVVFGGAWLFYGAFDELTRGAFLWGGVLSAPGLLLDAGYLLGWVEVVYSAPPPKREAEPEPAVLALPGAAEAGGAMRALEPAKPLRGLAWAADGTLFWGGCGAMLLALLLLFISQDEFDSVLGLKLGGRWYHGAYWNNWWFVFYAFLWGGLASAVSGGLLFVARLNRREEP